MPFVSVTVTVTGNEPEVFSENFEAGIVIVHFPVFAAAAPVYAQAGFCGAENGKRRTAHRGQGH